MEDKTYKISFDGIDIKYSFRYQWTNLQFGDFYVKETTGDPDIIINDELFKTGKSKFDEKAADCFIEYRLLLNQTATYLSDHNRFFFHSVAMKWNDRAWLFTGKSGAGKTTQFLKWKELFPDEVEIICGDMPLLGLHGKDIIVNSSPWNGSERFGYGTDYSVPLGGIIDLEQADIDHIEVIDISKKARSLWSRLIGRPDTVNQIRNKESFLNHIMDNYPVWTLKNRADAESVCLTRETILNNEKV